MTTGRSGRPGGQVELDQATGLESSTTRSGTCTSDLGPDREVAHGDAVPHQHHGDQFVGAVPAAEVQRLGVRPSGRDQVGQSAVQRRGLVDARSPWNAKMPCRKLFLLGVWCPFGMVGGSASVGRAVVGARWASARVGSTTGGAQAAMVVSRWSSSAPPIRSARRRSLERGHPARVEAVVGQHVGAGRPAPVERDEQRVRADVVE